MVTHIKQAVIILFVEDQVRSRIFYESIFRKKAEMDVPGMTEFILTPSSTLGIMPTHNIARIIDKKLPHPDTGQGIPRCELYLYVEDVENEYLNALAAGARLVSPIAERNWGDIACYFADPDGNIIAFARKTS